MIHLYLSLPRGQAEEHRLVDEILALDAGIGLVQVPGNGEVVATRAAAAHITACEGMIAIVSGAPSDHQENEISSAFDSNVPLLFLSDDADIDELAGRPVEAFTPEAVLRFIDALRSDE